MNIIVNLAGALVLITTGKTTPVPFARRNDFCGDRPYQNKHALHEWLQEARHLALCQAERNVSSWCMT